jgi:hypothetical protein
VSDGAADCIQHYWRSRCAVGMLLTGGSGATWVAWGWTVVVCVLMWLLRALAWCGGWVVWFLGAGAQLCGKECSACIQHGRSCWLSYQWDITACNTCGLVLFGKECTWHTQPTATQCGVSLELSNARISAVSCCMSESSCSDRLTGTHDMCQKIMLW